MIGVYLYNFFNDFSVKKKKLTVIILALMVFRMRVISMIQLEFTRMNWTWQLVTEIKAITR